MHDTAVCLLADAAPTREADAITGFGGVAYSGGVVPNFGLLGDMAIDLSSISLPRAEVPVHFNHNPDKIVGRALVVNDGKRLLLKEGRFSAVTEEGKRLAGLMAEGQPFQFSVGVNGRVKRQDRSKPVKLNGAEITVDASMHASRLLEVSFVSAGADPNTYAAQLAARSGSHSPTNGVDSMENDATVAALNTRIAELEAQVATLKAERDTARTELTNLAAVQRNEQIAALFGAEHEHTDAALTAYRSMSPEAFAAMRDAVLNARAAVDGNGELFRRTASAGKDPDAGAGPTQTFKAPDGLPVDPEGAKLHAKAVKYQAEHPGTDFITAVKSVSGV